jgi:murein DD-endopeptidase MepM/ murein hydrolase activator NlpD/lysophospholipase L1-like esterase
VASELSAEQQELYDRNILYYDIGCSSGGTTTTTGTVENAYMLGDSITEGAESQLKEEATKENISLHANASVSRSIKGAGITQDRTSGLQAIEDDKNESEFKDADAIVVSLGTNPENNFGGAMNSLIDKIENNSEAQLYWVNIFSEGGQNGYARINKASINRTIDQVANDRGVSVIDVNKSGINNNLSDSIHLNGEGKKAFAQEVAAALSGSPEGAGGVVGPDCSCGESVSLSGNDNAEKIWNFFISEGFKPNQVAGIMGNFWVETGGTFSPTIVQGGGNSDEVIINGSSGYGLAQWTFITRQQGLKDFADRKGLSSGTLEAQLQYVIYELSHGYSVGWGDSISIDDAAVLWESAYENPAAGSTEERKTRAHEMHAQFSGGDGGGGVSAGGCAGGTGDVVEGIAWPVPKEWWDSNPEFFTGPHHSYPAVDIGVPTGTEVYSMLDGDVIAVTTSGNCGYGVIVDSPGGIRITYCHGPPGSLKVNAGDKVDAGQQIMSSNETGTRVSGTHLHIQIAVGGVGVCPQNIFKNLAQGKGTEIEELPTGGCVSGSI